jgi:hypothetical protein
MLMGQNSLGPNGGCTSGVRDMALCGCFLIFFLRKYSKGNPCCGILLIYKYKKGEQKGLYRHPPSRETTKGRRK